MFIHFLVIHLFAAFFFQFTKFISIRCVFVVFASHLFACCILSGCSLSSLVFVVFTQHLWDITGLLTDSLTILVLCLYVCIINKLAVYLWTHCTLLVNSVVCYVLFCNVTAWYGQLYLSMTLGTLFLLVCDVFTT